MKFIIFLTILLVLEIRGESFDYSEYGSVITNDQLRTLINHNFNKLVGSDVDEICPHVLTPEQTVFGNQKLAEFGTCGRTTINKFVDKLNFELKLEDLSNTATMRNYIGPVCQVFDDILKCIRGAEPVIDLCISPGEKQFKARLFTITPLIQQTICLKNGSLLGDLFEHVDLTRCLDEIGQWIMQVPFDEIMVDDNTTEFFGSEKVCSEFNRIRLEAYSKVRECSVGLLDIISEMLGYFCEGTNCHRFIRNLECF